MNTTKSLLNNSTKPPPSESLQDQVESVLNLVMGHCEGKVSNRQVEAAVTNVVHTYKPKVLKKKAEETIEVDEDDYDTIEKESTFSFRPVDVETSEDVEYEVTDDNDYINELEKIPLGRNGSKMMIIFGDGPHPKPSSVSIALSGVRQCLHQAIKEARALRRKMRMEYDQAKSILDKQGAVDVGVEEVDPNMYYKALIGRDRAGIMEIGCGFDLTQLKTLFPEEVREFHRWKSMHEEYENSVENKEERGRVSMDAAPGHLRTRLAQFDIRTDSMKCKNYLTFAELRRQGFLSRSFVPEGSAIWNQIRSEKPEDGSRRKKKVGTWEALHPASIQFLHWIGFDPQSALPPPNEDTTNVLAFLAYDFMGKIVEKALCLRFKGGWCSRREVLQLMGGEQLEPEDIRKALDSHSSIHAVTSTPIYSSSYDTNYGKSVVTPQLYFGPGFETRLEAELQL